nr:immunoglobulin light chain junction region [Macaca mulatta]MOY10342.1 immunoglobulin light chain junction region [Macaca mulatta]MOY10348.1 immunoglobulin light chain junction region [Macaca mulatta]MOY10359.1 immunoglobulin light chain junction region [Macaca mulatta]MOY10427.1 immunoglobulin light chain junction region [Macaca mulatta]
CLQTKDFPYSF